MGMELIQKVLVELVVYVGKEFKHSITVGYFTILVVK